MNNTDKNNLIAKFMGGYIIREEEYESPHGSRSTGIIYHWEKPEGLPIDDRMADIGYFKYDTSWDWLMPVIRKINSLDKATQFAIFKTYVSCTVERGGKFYKDFAFSHAEYITAEQSDIEAAWKLVVKFVEWNASLSS
jgi:hypothetical protein